MKSIVEVNLKGSSLKLAVTSAFLQGSLQLSNGEYMVKIYENGTAAVCKNGREDFRAHLINVIVAGRAYYYTERSGIDLKGMFHNLYKR